MSWTNASACDNHTHHHQNSGTIGHLAGFTHAIDELESHTDPTSASSGDYNSVSIESASGDEADEATRAKKPSPQDTDAQVSTNLGSPVRSRAIRKRDEAPSGMYDTIAPTQSPHAGTILGADLMTTFATTDNSPVSGVSLVTTDDRNDGAESANPGQATATAAVGFTITNDHVIIGNSGATEDTADTQIVATFNRICHLLLTAAEWKAGGSHETGSGSTVTSASPEPGDVPASPGPMTLDVALPLAPCVPETAASTSPPELPHKSATVGESKAIQKAYIEDAPNYRPHKGIRCAALAKACQAQCNSSTSAS